MQNRGVLETPEGRYCLQINTKTSSTVKGWVDDPGSPYHARRILFTKSNIEKLPLWNFSMLMSSKPILLLSKFRMFDNIKHAAEKMVLRPVDLLTPETNNWHHLHTTLPREYFLSGWVHNPVSEYHNRLFIFSATSHNGALVWSLDILLKTGRHTLLAGFNTLREIESAAQQQIIKSI